jgi:predicted acetyltransferase
MRKLLDQTHAEISERGMEPIAALWASQPPIYGRFGYGLAAPSLSVVIPRAHGSLSRAPHDPDLSLRLVEPAADLTVANSVYEAVRSRRPGMSRVDERWHAANVSDAKEDREGKSALATVVVEGTDGVEAYARYALKHNWSAGYADGLIDVRTLVAATPAAEAALWRYLIDYELSGSVDAWNLPSDSPIRWWLDQPRHAKRQLHDSLYVRLIDVGQALSARTYTRPIDVVLDVTDQYCPWNTGRWRLSGDQSGATCEQTPDAADLSMDVATLGAAYLGGTSLADLAGAAWVEELRSGSLAECSHAFNNQPAPWSPFVF